MENGKVAPRDLTTTIHLSSHDSSNQNPSSSHIAAIIDNLSPETIEVLRQLPSGVGMLLVLIGSARGSRFLLDEEKITIGRVAESQIALDDVTVSRKHAVIERAGNSGFKIRDLGSLNGTYVGGVLINEAVLANGSEINIGKFKLVFFANNGELSNLLGNNENQKGEIKK